MSLEPSALQIVFRGQASFTHGLGASSAHAQNSQGPKPGVNPQLRRTVCRNVELVAVVEPVSQWPWRVCHYGLGQDARLPGQVTLGKSGGRLWKTFSVKKERIHMVLIVRSSVGSQEQKQ